MIKSTYNVLGVMSGTSLDGVDLAHIEFSYNKVWSYSFKGCKTIPYTKEWIKKLKMLVAVSPEELQLIDQDYTLYLASLINQFLDEQQIYNLDFISSHGHTALHQPENGLTIQIGNRKNLAQLTNHTVVCDFRVQDVLLGGQGAPLVPIGDKLLFSNYDYCLNLGGFANISTDKSDKRIAFDICPVNIVLNHYVTHLGLEYDDAGKIAASGTCNVSLLQALNNLSFYKKQAPKSLGLEWVGNYIFPLIDSYNLSVPNILRTFIAHVVEQIGKQVTTGRLLITGGGAYNSFLIEELKKQIAVEIIIPSSDLLEYKEALIFGLLGVLKFQNKVNCLASVTGAKHNHSSGKIYKV
ncbi:anhydro-N-acetylmuramic acid kinase [Bizionia sp. KMM 8389]